MKSYDVVIVGGGPGGLSAALALGRGRARALLVDGGTPRNARAHEVHNFVTRDGTPPQEFRAIARAQIAAYPSVEVRDAYVSRIERAEAPTGEPGAGVALGRGFSVFLDQDHEPLHANRVLLATGMRDQLPDIPGLTDFWGTSVFQCPYCHGWEFRDQPWGVIVPTEQMASFAPMLTNWSSGLTAFTQGAAITEDTQRRLQQCGVRVETSPIAKLVGTQTMDSVQLASGAVVPCRALVFHPPQLPVELVLALGLARDEAGFVQVDPTTKESSVPGIYVVGDTTTMRQAAIMAAADGMGAATMINHARIMERFAVGPLSR